MDIKKIRANFPALQKNLDRPDLVYFDNAATSQKPKTVIDALVDFYSRGCANIHRSIYNLGEETTNQYNLTRTQVAKFINAQDYEIIFTSGATEGVNFIASTWGVKFIQPGDEIIVSVMEHHANLIPWQQLARRTGAILKVITLTAEYLLDLDHYQSLLSSKTKLVAVTHSSNVLGVINDLGSIIKHAKQMGCAVLVDASQSAPYTSLDVNQLGCDFLVFSGHKMLAPDGVGVLYISKNWHAQIEPYQFGGGIVSDVKIDKSIFLSAPGKFEAGTMPIASIFGLGAALDYYQSNIDFLDFKIHLAKLCEQLIEALVQIPQVKIIGNQRLLKKEGHLVSFVVQGYHAHDVAAYLSQFGICVRAGNHCAQPLHDYLGLSATLRVSFQVYNTSEELDFFLIKLTQLIQQGFELNL